MILFPWRWVKEFHRQACALRAKWANALDAQRRTEEMLMVSQMAYSKLARDAKIVGAIPGVVRTPSGRGFTFAMPVDAMKVEVNADLNPKELDHIRRDFSTLCMKVSLASLDGIEHLTREQAAASLHLLLAQESEAALEILERDRFKAAAKDGREHGSLREYDDDDPRSAGFKAPPENRYFKRA